MVRFIPLHWSILLVIIAAGCHQEEAQEPALTTKQQALVAELNTGLALPFSNHPLTLSDDALSTLNELGRASIVGLGEATHGSKEFFEIKHRLFRYLVENFGHRAFGFECDFAESLYFDTYVTTGAGDLTQLMRTKMHFWIWKTTEVRALLEWMRQYNAGKTEEDQIHFYGFDCQQIDQQPPLLLAYFEKNAPALYQRTKSILTSIQTTMRAESLTHEPKYLDSLASIQTYLDEHKAPLIQASSVQEWQIMKQLVTTLEQAIHVAGASDRNLERDRYMADNVRWLQQMMGDASKISIWAHNYHIGNFFQRTTGAYLKADLHDAYQRVGFTFSTGAFMAASSDGNVRTQMIQKAPIESSINHLLHNAQSKNFALPLKNTPPNSGWPEFLAGTNSILSVGVTYTGDPVDHYYFLPIGQTFDWLIYFDEVRASEPL
ncbi:erythromycin esterase [Catalinimonas alkaloidigena]|uniref:Erythromycin esterase n=1 Tax=Catalinimonas alkaloidigena TaxID=1075417 RepID=A0A1G8XRY5_9BACT|nr:erythromycin esterase family protein [Catalinimonas alkaloidigena]SDJ93329.1 erythromycin esterase [Catalinimonas alkaloidigena]